MSSVPRGAGDAAAVATLREAGDAVAHRAPASAATWFGHALRLLPDSSPADARVELLLSRARVLVATGQFAEGHAALLESVDLVPADAVALRVRLTTACAGVEHLLGRHEQAHARLASAMDSLRDPASPEAAALMIELAMDGFSRMDYELMREWAERALSTARPLGDRPLTAAAVSVLAFAGAASGATPEAETRRAEAAALVADLDDDELALRLDAAASLAGAELYLDRYEEAEAHAERAIAVGRATGQSEFIPLAVLDSRASQAAARPAGRSRRAARQRRRGSTTVGQRPSARRAISATAPLRRSRPATSRSRSPPPRSASS